MKDIEDKTYTGEEVKDLLRKRARTRTARLRTAIASAQQKRGSVYAPKVVEEDPLTGKYANIDPRTGLALIQPKFDFFTLKRIAEESDAVSALIDVMRKNIEGFGFGLRFLGKDLDAKKPENDKNRVFLEDFFKYCNDSESFVTITSKKRFDMEQIGSGAMEVIRAADKKTIAAIYHLPMHFIRATTQDKEPTTIVYPLRRAGVVVNVPYVKYFRRFVQISPTGVILRYYKEYGDPRTISAATGEVISADAPAAECATEIILDTIYSGNYLYGLPRWLGAIMDVLGRRNAQTVNWDLFESQGIPRLMVMVSGGTLTEESYGALEELLMEARGIANYNKVTLLEANSDSLGLDDRTNTARIDFKNLSEARQDDLMFTRYLEYTAKSIRSCFRIPPLLLGLVDDYSLANARAAMAATESQVFIPERIVSDEIVNRKIVQSGFGIHDWVYYNKAIRVTGTEEASLMMKAFGKTGAFTINHAIALANESFGLSMSLFDEPWANYPYDIIMELLRVGRLKDLDTVAEKAIQNNAKALEQYQQNNDIGNIDELSSPAETEAKKIMRGILQPTEFTLYDTLDKLRKCLSVVNNTDQQGGA